MTAVPRHLYNLVTQLGGWRTIYSNRWQPLLYCTQAAPLVHIPHFWTD